MKLTRLFLLVAFAGLFSTIITPNLSHADTCDDGPNIPCVPVQGTAIKVQGTVYDISLDGFRNMYSSGPMLDPGSLGDGGGESEFDSSQDMRDRDPDYDDRPRCKMYGMRHGKSYSFGELADFGFVRGDGSDKYPRRDRIYEMSGRNSGVVKNGKACM